MNNPTPLVPQGITDPKNKNRARVKIGVFFVLAVHGAGLLALLLQGCHREDATAQANQNTNAAPAFEATNLPTVAEPTAPPATNQIPATPEATPTPSAPTTEYTVATGDRLGTIAKKFNVTVTALKEANPGVEPTKLQIGKSLHIPAPVPKAAVATTPGAPATPLTTPSTEAAHGNQLHTVKSGDTLIKIASVNHTTVRAIRTANNLKSDRITVGQKLKIPAKTPVASTETASALTTGSPGSH
jgi:LysM repeat protein